MATCDATASIPEHGVQTLHAGKCEEDAVPTTARLHDGTATDAGSATALESALASAMPFKDTASALVWWEGARGSLAETLGTPPKVSAAQFSFSLTASAAVRRLALSGLIPCTLGDHSAKPGDEAALSIHMLGADVVEGTTEASIVVGFLPLFLALAPVWPRLSLTLCGPGLSTLFDGGVRELRPLGKVHPDFVYVTGVAVVALHRPVWHAAHTSCCDFRCNLQVVSGLYHELATQAWFTQPHVAFMFDSGFWGGCAAHRHAASVRGNIACCGVAGYDSWVPTLELLAKASSHPCVSTSYNMEEAEDDRDVVADAGFKTWVWEPAPNAFASSERNVPQPPMYRELVDNCVWQCFHGTA